MSTSLSQIPAAGSTASAKSQLAVSETRAFESQITVPKKQETSIDHYIEVARKFQGSIPYHQDSEKDVQEYYQGALKNIRAFKTAVEDGDIAVSKVEGNLQELALQIKKLFNLLNSYKSKSYQWKFNMDQYNTVFDSINLIGKSLESLEKELGQFEKGLKWFELENESSLRHLGPEFTEEKVLAYLGPSQIENKSLLLYEGTNQKLAEKDREIHDRTLRFEESVKNVKELEGKLGELKKRLKEMENLIEEKKKSLLSSAEARHKFRMELNDKMASVLEEMHSKNKKGQEKAINFCNQRIEEIDKMLAELLQKFAHYSTANPFFHIIFVLDHSGSMCGTRWNSLLKALEVFIEKNKNHSKNLISMILFDNSAVEVMKKAEIHQYKTPQSSKWGGTNFDPAFEMALDFTNLSRTHCPVVVFLTDGDGTMRETPKFLREMNKLHKSKGFMMFSVGVGDEYNVENLKTITRTANGGELYVDLGIDRIEYLHTAKDGGVLDKIFTDISNAINGMALKIKSVMEALKKEKIEVQEEAGRLSEFYSTMSEQELKDIKKKQEDLLNQKIELLKLKDSEEKTQIEFCQKEKELLFHDIETCQNQIQAEQRVSTPGEIDKLNEERNDLEKKKKEAWEDKELFSAEKKKILSQLKNRESNMNLQTSCQLFEFNRAKHDFENMNYERRVYLGEMKIFVSLLRRTISQIQGELEITNPDENGLEARGAFDIVLEYCSKTIDIKENDDFNNVLKIATHILGIKVSDKTKMEFLELLLGLIHPRRLVDPTTDSKKHENLITDLLEEKSTSDMESLNNKSAQLKEKCKKIETQLKNKAEEVKTLKEEIQELEFKEIPNRERLVREFKADIKKTPKTDEDNQENTNPNQVSSDDGNEALKEELAKARKHLEEKKSMLIESKKDLIYLKNKVEEMEAKKEKIDEEISEMKKNQKASEKIILRFYGLLRDDFETKIQKYLKDRNIAEIQNFQKNIMEGLMPLIDKFLSQM